MALPHSSERSLEVSDAIQKKFTITNQHGEKLVGVLHDIGSKRLVILCHGFQSSKDEKTILNLAAALTREGYNAFRFDFAGNGESEGVFQYGNYWREAEDVCAVILHFTNQKYEISAIVGHSKGGNVVLLHASKYHNVPLVVNISGRFALDRGMEGRLGKDFMQRIKRDGFIDVKDRKGRIEYRVFEESLLDRLNTDMRAACQSIDKECRICTVHGTADEMVPTEDAMEFAKNLPNHQLHIIEGANHRYAAHQEQLTKIVLDFISSNQAHVGLKESRIILSKL